MSGPESLQGFAKQRHRRKAGWRGNAKSRSESEVRSAGVQESCRMIESSGAVHHERGEYHARPINAMRDCRSRRVIDACQCTFGCDAGVADLISDADNGRRAGRLLRGPLRRILSSLLPQLLLPEIRILSILSPLLQTVLWIWLWIWLWIPSKILWILWPSLWLLRRRIETTERGREQGGVSAPPCRLPGSQPHGGRSAQPKDRGPPSRDLDHDAYPSCGRSCKACGPAPCHIIGDNRKGAVLWADALDVRCVTSRPWEACYF